MLNTNSQILIQFSVTLFCKQFRVMGVGVQALQNTYGTKYQYGNHATTICKLTEVFPFKFYGQE